MALIILAVVVLLVIWWLKSQKALNLNEKLYLRRRGYEHDQTEPKGRPVDPDSRLLGLMHSLTDLSPYARQRAADELSRMCTEGKRDSRMFESLVNALGDSEASVRSAVATALGNLGDPRAIELLKHRMDLDESIHFRAAVLKALKKLSEVSN
jgi:hypothetical protein